MKRLLFLLLLGVGGCKEKEEVPAENLLVYKISLDGNDTQNASLVEIPLRPEIRVEFSHAPEPGTNFSTFVILLNKNNERIPLNYQISGTSLTVSPLADLPGFQKYTFVIQRGLPSSTKGTLQREHSFLFYTTYDPQDKFERISREVLLDKVQAQTFKYFWDFAHPASGMIRERNTSQATVTTGGTGFGIMGIVTGAERKFITRTEGLERVKKIVSFLEKADSYHGAFAHWYNAETGKTQPFSAKDNGADLVETSFLFMGLLTAAEYFNDSDLTRRVNALYQAVEWNFFLNGTESLFWHWSPDYGFELNLKIRGWNEALMVYVLAAGSEKYAIEKANYVNGWTRNGGFVNGNSYHGIRLPLGPDYGGPLFMSQYSFLGINPFGLSDDYIADYAVQCRDHTLINRAYCIANPGRFPGYNRYSWGLTASDNPGGYAAHSPRNDKGVITPTAALGSFPYTPEESMEALEFFYYKSGDRLWGEYGFKDAYSVKDDWYAGSYIAIDQGPILIGIENYRSGLLWKNGMKSPPVQKGLKALGFKMP